MSKSITTGLDKDFWNMMREPCPHPSGTRIRLISMPDDPDPVPAGTMGTVDHGNGAQLFVKWDNGRSLHLLVGIDKYEVV